MKVNIGSDFKAGAKLVLEHSIKNACMAEPYHHGVVDAGRDIWTPSSSNLLFKQGHLYTQPPVLQYCLWSCAGHHWTEPGSVFFVPSLQLSTTLQTALQLWFTSSEYRGRITYLDLLATHFSMYPRIPLDFFYHKHTYCRLMLLLSTKNSSILFWKAAFQTISCMYSCL